MKICSYGNIAIAKHHLGQEKEAKHYKKKTFELSHQIKLNKGLYDSIVSELKIVK